GRGADVEVAFGVKGDGLGREIGGFERHTGLAVRIEAKHLCGRAACSVKHAFGIDSGRPEVGGVGVREELKTGREFEAAVAANGDTSGRALQKIIVGGEAPVASVFCAKGERKSSKEAKRQNGEALKRKNSVSRGALALHLYR